MVAETELRPKLIMASPVVGRHKTSTIKPRQKFEGHTDMVFGAIHLPDGQRMMTCSFDGSLRVWNLKSGKQIGVDWRDGDSGVRTVALSLDGTKVVSGSSDGRVRLWDIGTGRLIATWTGHTEMVYSVCWSRDGHRVVSGSLDGTAREWNVEKGDTILRPIKTAIVYSPDMTMFATKYWVRLGDVELPNQNLGCKDTRGCRHSRWTQRLCLAWSRDEKTLISGSYDHGIPKHGSSSLCLRGTPRHYNISEWPHPRKRIVRQNSTIVEPRK
jgi:WD40 repeat protein